jgi:hypothetical protein
VRKAAFFSARKFRWRQRQDLARNPRVITFHVDFIPHPFEKTGIEQTKEDIRSRLAGHDIQRLKIVMKKPAGGEIALQFLGDPQMVEKARRVLGIY